MPEGVVRRWSASVALFHEKYDFPQTTYHEDREAIEWRAKLATEEAQELWDAMEDDDEWRPPADAIREAIDVIYISLGTLYTYGLRPWGGAMSEVMAMDARTHYEIRLVTAHCVKHMASDETTPIRYCCSMLIQLAVSVIQRIVGRRCTPEVLEMFFNEVHRANMDKGPGEGSPRPTKKRGWRAPQIEAILAAL